MEYSTFEEVLAENDRRKRLIAEASRSRYADLTDTRPSLDVLARDFEYWAATTVTIRDKTTGRNVPFILNRAQRRVLTVLEDMRLNDEPIRLILLKARQWGGSTLIQLYFSWIQLMHRRNWHSAICAHVKDAARNIRGMYSALLENYPDWVCANADEKPRFIPFQGSQNVRVIHGRDCRVTIASAENQESVRGSDLAMAHMSEVAFWKATPKHDPEDFLRAVCSSVPMVPYSLVAIESTANGVGNFFHNEWLRATAGVSDKKPVFVPWYEIDIYSLPVKSPEALWSSLTDYERRLWDEHGCTLEQINWYRRKLAEYPKPELMHAEFPTTADEAFVSSDANVFANADIERLRSGCLKPRKGFLSTSRHFVAQTNGQLSLWHEPGEHEAYVVTVDVGGRSAKSDWSVIAVMAAGTKPEVVAQWRGHTDHDLLAKQAMEIARWYNNALLVIESNTLETADDSSSADSVLQYVAMNYTNVYRRTRSRLGVPQSPGIGFHTNRHTKSLIIDELIRAVREGAYVERDNGACNELATYCRFPNGSYGARRGCHDDILMTRAIALYVMAEQSHLFTAAAPSDPLPGLT